MRDTHSTMNIFVAGMQVVKWGSSMAVRLPAVGVEALDQKAGEDIDSHARGGCSCAMEMAPAREPMSGREDFVDTNVLLHLLSADTAQSDRAEELLGFGGTISVQVLNDCVAVTSRTLRT
jgi:antitoxin component of MazEF toxin-antitoxin module